MEMQFRFCFHLKMFEHKQAPFLFAAKSKPKNNHFYLQRSQQAIEM